MSVAVGESETMRRGFVANRTDPFAALTVTGNAATAFDGVDVEADEPPPLNASDAVPMTTANAHARSRDVSKWNGTDEKEKRRMAVLPGRTRGHSGRLRQGRASPSGRIAPGPISLREDDGSDSGQVS
jgi:hypothetical protein